MVININEPLDIFGNDPWQCIADHSDPEEYSVIDLIFQFLVGEIEREDLPDQLRNKTIDELHAEYNRLFPIVYGGALQDIGTELVSGKMSLKIDFSLLKKENIAQYRCTLCHSTDVKMKVWENPNTQEISFEPSLDEDDMENCWCNRCETHVELEPVSEEKYVSQPQQIYVCPECGSDDVEIRQWIKPNEGDKPSGNDCLDSEDCWCNNCEGHNKLEIKDINSSKTNNHENQ